MNTQDHTADFLTTQRAAVHEALRDLDLSTLPDDTSFKFKDEGSTSFAAVYHGDIFLFSVEAGYPATYHRSRPRDISIRHEALVRHHHGIPAHSCGRTTTRRLAPCGTTPDDRAKFGIRLRKSVRSAIEQTVAYRTYYEETRANERQYEERRNRQLGADIRLAEELRHRLEAEGLNGRQGFSVRNGKVHLSWEGPDPEFVVSVVKYAQSLLDTRVSTSA